jgi:hypothetical protein
MMTLTATTTSPSSQSYDDKPFIRKRRPRRRVSSKNEHAHVIGCCALVASCLFLVLLYKAQEILDSIATQTDFRLSANVLLHRLKKTSRKAQRKFPSASVSKYQPPSDLSKPPPSKFLIFDSDLPGQGMGNVVSGLLSAHLLALEFDRLVCTTYPMLFEAFELAHPWAIERCPKALNEMRFGVGVNHLKHISMITFDTPPDECHLKRVLSSDETFVIMFGNTYPRYDCAITLGTDHHGSVSHSVSLDGLLFPTTSSLPTIDQKRSSWTYFHTIPNRHQPRWYICEHLTALVIRGWVWTMRV